MAKVSKNSRTDRGINKQEKNMVKVIKAIKSSKSGAYTFKDKMVHKDAVSDYLKED